MSILAWIEDQRKLKLLNAPKYNHPASDGSKGLWTRCDHCGVILYIKHLKENKRVCFGCGYHLQMNSQERINHIIDESTWRPFDETLSPCDPLEFCDQKPYIERLKDSQERTGLQDAVQTGTGMVYDIPVALGIMDFYFMGGSMGSVVGEKITRLIEYATQEGLTLILVCASGGARMQEGVLSLMQMAKISAALQIYQSYANLLYISVLTSPTTGGVTASFAMLGDLIFAEPKALIGFAGRRVIEQTLQEQLPDDFQTSEYLLHHGLLDLIIPRSFLKSALFETITLYKEAPLKKTGTIPYGIQQNFNFVTEEKVRRKWFNWKKISNTEFKVDTQVGKLINEELSYREILTSFQTMTKFFDCTVQNKLVKTVCREGMLNQSIQKKNVNERISKNTIFTEKNFNNFILKCQKLNKTISEGEKINIQNFDKFNLLTSLENDNFYNENETQNLLSKSESFDQKSSYKNDLSYLQEEILKNKKENLAIKFTQEIMEWGIFYTTQNKNVKTKFLQTFINEKNKNFFYKFLI